MSNKEFSIGEVEGLVSKATPGPWEVAWGTKHPHIKAANGHYIQEHGWPVRKEGDAPLIAAAPSLARQLVRVMKENEELREKMLERKLMERL